MSFSLIFRFEIPLVKTLQMGFKILMKLRCKIR